MIGSSHVTLVLVLTLNVMVRVRSEERVLGYGTKFGTVTTEERKKVIGEEDMINKLQADDLHWKDWELRLPS